MPAPPAPDMPAPPPPPPAPPAPPAPPKLPANVKRIEISNNKASIWLKNGQQEKYDLNNEEEKKKFDKKYGKVPEPAGQSSVSSVNMQDETEEVSAVKVMVAPAQDVTVSVKPDIVASVKSNVPVNVSPQNVQAVVKAGVINKVDARVNTALKAKPGASVIVTTAPAEQ
jgi:hypothetical protein